MTRGAKLLLVPTLFLEVVFFTFVARHRFLNGDEGFYLLAVATNPHAQEPCLELLFSSKTPLLALRLCTMDEVRRSVVDLGTTVVLFALTADARHFSYMGMFASRREVGSQGFAAAVMFCLEHACLRLFSTVVTTFSPGRALFLFSAYVVVSRPSVKRPLHG